MGNVSRYTSLLCALLFAGCMDDTLCTPDEDRYADDCAREQTQQSAARDAMAKNRQRATSHSRLSHYGVQNHRSTTYDQSMHHATTQDDTPEKKVCVICLEENALKEHGEHRFPKCGHIICRECYRNIRESSGRPIEGSYGVRNSTNTYTYQLEARCPFCRK